MNQPRPGYLPLIRPPADVDGPAIWFAFREGEIAVLHGTPDGRDGNPLPVCTELTEIGLVADTQHYLGLYDRQHCYAVALAADTPLPANLKLQGLCGLFGKLDEGLAVLAGFVEPGEELEDTAHREVREEVGIDIDDLRYFGSQPRPFPHSLMVAFTAQYAGGDLRPDGVEIGEAKWFDAADVLKRPYTPSIGWRLVNTVAGRLARGETI